MIVEGVRLLPIVIIVCSENKNNETLKRISDCEKGNGSLVVGFVILRRRRPLLHSLLAVAVVVVVATFDGLVRAMLATHSITQNL